MLVLLYANRIIVTCAYYMSIQRISISNVPDNTSIMPHGLGSPLGRGDISERLAGHSALLHSPWSLERQEMILSPIRRERHVVYGVSLV